jgi:hypothetical protein
MIKLSFLLFIATVKSQAIIAYVNLFYGIVYTYLFQFFYFYLFLNLFFLTSNVRTILKLHPLINFLECCFKV